MRIFGLEVKRKAALDEAHNIDGGTGISNTWFEGLGHARRQSACRNESLQGLTTA
jgi:hypothetical protein